MLRLRDALGNRRIPDKAGNIFNVSGAGMLVYLVDNGLETKSSLALHRC